MTIDRSKFKATSVAVVQQQDKELSSMTGKKNERAGYLKIKPGKNMFRLAPAHPDDPIGTSFIQPKSTVWLPMMMEERDEKGQVVKGADGHPVMKEGNKTVFNSRVHGGTEKDLVEEYFKIAEEWAKANKFSNDPKKDEDERKKYLSKIWGNFAAKIQGIRYNHNWAFYAWDLMDNKNPFGLLEAKTSVKEGINKIINVEASNQPIGTEATEPFTDADNGRALVIMYDDKAQKASDYYSVSIDTSTEPADIGGRKVQIQKVFPLTDEQLEAFIAFPSLYKMFIGSFKKRDFMLQVSGLEFFDKKNGMGIFNSAKFQDVMAEISLYYPDEKEPTEEEMTASETVVETETGEEESGDIDQFSVMSRDELKTFNVENKCGILIKQTTSDDQIRERLREWVEVNAMNESATDENIAEATAPVEKEKKEAVMPNNMPSAADKLAALKTRMNKG